jgi:hypothetical protein
MSKALIPLGLIGVAGVMGSLANGEANRGRRAVTAGDKDFKPGDWVRMLKRVSGKEDFRLHRVQRISKLPSERLPRIYIRRWNKSRGKLNKTQDWAHASDLTLVAPPAAYRSARGRRAALPGRKYKMVGSVEIRHNRDWDEYIVIPANARNNPAVWYHTDDRQDAVDTANSIENRNFLSTMMDRFGPGGRD